MGHGISKLAQKAFENISEKAGNKMMNGVAIEKMGANEVGPPARAGRSQLTGMTQDKLQGLLSDAPFAEGMMASSARNGNMQHARQQGLSGAEMGMGAYQDMASMGMKSDFSPMMGMQILNQMQYRPAQRRQFVPIWTVKRPWEV